MPVIVLPDGTEAEFPDSMSDADIKVVLRKKFPPPDAIGDSAKKIVNEMGPVEGAFTAFGEAARHTIRQGANLLPGGIGPSDAEVAESSKINEPLFRKHPIASFLGGASLQVPTAVAAGTIAAPAVGTGLLANAAASGLLGAGQGAVFSDPGSRGTNAAIGGALGTALPLVIGGGKNILKKTLEKLGITGATPTDSAKALMREGVPLTRGQMNPEGVAGQIEEVGTSTALFGPAVKAKREAALEAWRNATLKRGVPPGATVPNAPGIESKLADTRELFDAAYGQFRDVPVPLQEAQRLGQRIPKSLIPNLSGRAGGGIEASAVNNASSAVGDAVSTLPSGAFSGTAPVWNHMGDVTATALPPWLKVGDLTKVREVVRDQIRQAVKAQDWEQLRLLKSTESEITAAAEKALGAKAAALRQVDKAYSNFMTLENAAGRGGPSHEFTPRQLHAAIRAKSGNLATVEGKAGELQDLAQAGADVFDARSPTTGHRLLSVIPVVGKYLHGPVALGMNTDAAKRMALKPVTYGVEALTPGKMTMNELLAELLRQKESR
jgi:hypothetical protein